MDLSLVVATRDRAHRLKETLEKISKISTNHAWELVLVDNGSRDRTAEVIREFTASAPMPVLYVHEPRPGLGRALNAGAEASGGRIIATTDDDCYPSPRYVDDVLHVFRRHDVGYVGGRVLLYDESDARVSILEGREPVLIPSGYFPYPGIVGGGNLAFRRELFHDVGGFDTEMGVGTAFPCEDIDICARASLAGWNGAYCPVPTVHHHHGRPPGPAEERVRAAYARARGAYYAKTLLEAPAFRRSCLKWWYWSLSSIPTRHVFREVVSGLRYLLHRALGTMRERASVG